MVINPTTVQDAGNFPGFTFNLTYSDIASGVNAGGTFKYSGNYGDAEAALLKAGFQAYPGVRSIPSIYHRMATRQWISEVLEQ